MRKGKMEKTSQAEWNQRLMCQAMPLGACHAKHSDIPGFVQVQIKIWAQHGSF